MRLDKFICKSTNLSRTQAIEQIHSGSVSVNSVIIQDEATQVHQNNTVTLNGEALQARPFRYILLHKPANTICSNVDEVYPSLFHYLDVDNVSELHIAGRLDADTTGMVLITDDGRWSYNITTPTNLCAKVYRVGLSRPIAETSVERFKQGIQLQGEAQLTHPAQLSIITPNEVLLSITQGKFHQVKRMFAAVGNRVVSLHREAIGGVHLDVDVEQWRYLSESEVQQLSH
ncbi:MULTISPECIES: pseudouridine synthase [Vibrio]|uniref:Ribosomal small subunit pseudouridine synthase A n=1 Tax=Vibrio algicola TaxID=2662262 RepID=A0A5Q0TMG5_9VIBR|nr:MULTISPECIES: pseudouridine synthase [Vibrio]MBD1577423.1 pseudouridine synthase [Vibrio sp. S11_S32]